MNKSVDHQDGFTIVELLIATTVFSIVLTVVVFAVLFVSDNFIRGGIESQTQETARSIEQQVTQQIQLSGGSVTTNTTSQFICIGDDRYTYTPNTELLSGASGGLIEQNIPNCTTPSATSTNVTTQLLGDRMRLGDFEIDPLGNGLYNLKLIIGYGTDTTQGGSLQVTGTSQPFGYHCYHPTAIGGDFCAVSSLSTVVQQRVNNGE